MKKLGLVLTCALFLAVSSAFADTAVLTWTPNAEPDIAGYKVYQNTSPGITGDAPIITLSGPGATYTATIAPGPVDVRYYFTVAAYNTAGTVSGKSNEVSKLIGAAVTSIGVAPAALNISIPVGQTQGTGSITVTNTGNVPVTVTWSDTTSCLQGLVGLTRTIAPGANTVFTINGTCAATATATISGTGFASVVIPVTIVKALVPAPPTGLMVK